MRPTRSQRSSDPRPRLGYATPGTSGQSRGEAPGDVDKQVLADAAAADSGTAVPTVVGAYLREIGRTPLLRPEEEVALAQRVARGDTEAAHALAQANLRLVVTIAGHYRHSGLPLEDLIAEGNLGLLSAVQKYEWQRGCRFSTYAVWWIRQAITRAIGNHGHTIRIPIHLGEALTRHSRAADQMANALGRQPSADELAALPGPDTAYISAAASAIQTPLQLDMVVGESGAEHLADVLADESAVTPEEEAVRRLAREEACRVLHEVLTERERLVVMLRCGFDGGVPESLHIIGQRLGVGRERVRQIEDAALRKLRQPTVVARLGTDEAQCVA